MASSFPDDVVISHHLCAFLEEHIFSLNTLFLTKKKGSVSEFSKHFLKQTCVFILFLQLMMIFWFLFKKKKTSRPFDEIDFKKHLALLNNQRHTEKTKLLSIQT